MQWWQRIFRAIPEVHLHDLDTFLVSSTNNRTVLPILHFAFCIFCIKRRWKNLPLELSVKIVYN